MYNVQYSLLYIVTNNELYNNRIVYSLLYISVFSRKYTRESTVYFIVFKIINSIINRKIHSLVYICVFSSKDTRGNKKYFLEIRLDLPVTLLFVYSISISTVNLAKYSEVYSTVYSKVFTTVYTILLNMAYITVYSKIKCWFIE